MIDKNKEEVKVPKEPLCIPEEQYNEGPFPKKDNDKQQGTDEVKITEEDVKDLTWRLKIVINIINGLDNRFDELLDYAKKTNNLYLDNFVNGLCDYIEKELAKVEKGRKE